jgi:putative flippase GtrA
VRVFRSYPALAYQGLRFALTGLSSYLLYVFLFFVFSRVLGDYASLTLAYVAVAALHFVASKYFTYES